MPTGFLGIVVVLKRWFSLAFTDFIVITLMPKWREEPAHNACVDFSRRSDRETGLCCHLPQLTSVRQWRGLSTATFLKIEKVTHTGDPRAKRRRDFGG